MTATTISTNPHLRRVQRLIHAARPLGRGIGWLIAATRARWHDVVESGQLGPSPYQELSRHTGSRF
jgi:hypothetical protein